jgi:parallel beta-helix repeat protein
MEATPQFHATPPRLRWLGVILALAIADVGIWNGGEALASHVGCGDTITTDRTLDSDLINCQNNGIVIGADGVTLDLNGHLVDGDGTEFSGCNPKKEICDVGVANDGFDEVTVMHGRVRGFGLGVLVGTSTTGKVRKNRVIGISSLRNRFVGVAIFSATGGLVRNSSGSNSLARHGGVGLILGETSGVRVVGNLFEGNSDHGLFVVSSAHSLIKKNQVSRTATGIFLEDSDRNQVRGNRSFDVGEGILVVKGEGDVIAGNRVADIGGRGKGGGVGISVAGGRDNSITQNSVADARLGVLLGFAHPPVGSFGNRVLGNVVNNSGKDAFRIETKVRQTFLKDNKALAAGDDGFDIKNGSTKLTGNRAFRNADLGIEALLGVKDGGANIARHNGDPRQCTNITCN